MKSARNHFSLLKKIKKYRKCSALLEDGSALSESMSLNLVTFKKIKDNEFEMVFLHHRQPFLQLCLYNQWEQSKHLGRLLLALNLFEIYPSPCGITQ